MDDEVPKPDFDYFSYGNNNEEEWSGARVMKYFRDKDLKFLRQFINYLDKYEQVTDEYIEYIFNGFCSNGNLKMEKNILERGFFVEPNKYIIYSYISLYLAKKLYMFDKYFQ